MNTACPSPSFARRWGNEQTELIKEINKQLPIDLATRLQLIYLRVQWDMRHENLSSYQTAYYPSMPVINTVKNQESLELGKEGNAEGIECITSATPLSFKDDEHL